MLHVLIADPLALVEYLLPPRRLVRGSVREMDGDPPCIIDKVRDDTIWRATGEADEELIPDTLFQRLEFVLSYRQPHHIVWLFVALMEMNVSVYAMVASTFPGPPHVFEKLFGYLAVKLNGVVRSPYHPSTAGEIMRTFHCEVYAVLCHGFMRIVDLECSPSIEKTSCPRAEKSGVKRGRKSAASADAQQQQETLLAMYGDPRDGNLLEAAAIAAVEYDDLM